MWLVRPNRPPRSSRRRRRFQETETASVKVERASRPVGERQNGELNRDPTSSLAPPGPGSDGYRHYWL
jgi:hypothetical protein